MNSFDISALLFKGQLTSDIYIGAKLDNKEIDGLACWQKQDGDIPSAYEFYKNGVKFDISALDNIITYISTKFDYNETKRFKIRSDNQEEQNIAIKSTLTDVVKFLNRNNVEWEIDRIDTRGKSIGLLIKPKAKIMYSFEPEQFGFYQIVAFM